MNCINIIFNTINNLRESCTLRKSYTNIIKFILLTKYNNGACIAFACFCAAIFFERVNIDCA